ncbi:MAG: TetR/AcrR family transcriptional regulator [Lachnotalea sp.]
MSDYPLFTTDTTKHHSNKETNRLTREAICTALVLLLKEQPFGKIAITDIVKRAGVSRTAYYSNYSSKQEILIDLVNALILEINQKLLPYTEYVLMLVHYIMFFQNGYNPTLLKQLMK